MSPLHKPLRETRSFRPCLEALESRELMTVTDMTQLAQLFTRHTGPTILYVNFDGYTGQAVSPFQSTTGNLTKDINDILYRTAEIFAPFDVQVRRIFGNGQFASSGGNSTLFIGDMIENGTGDANTARAFVPHADHPGAYFGIHHQPNSDPFDLGFVDPVFMGFTRSGSPTLASWTNLEIAQTIAHEAGHTFGLGHVLSDPAPEIMSYDAGNVRFVNQTFNITDLNFNGTENEHDSGVVPQWFTRVSYTILGTTFYADVPNDILTQNSYTYLQTVLGSSNNDALADVADPTAVDGAFHDAAMPVFSAGIFSRISSIDQYGDYDVFQFSVPASKNVQIDLKPYNSSLDPVLFIYRGDGEKLLAFNDNGGGPAGVRTVNSQLTFSALAGETYRIVVGAAGNATFGAYQLSVNSQALNADITTTLTYSSATSFTTTSQTTTSLTTTSLATTSMTFSATGVSSSLFAIDAVILPSQDVSSHTTTPARCGSGDALTDSRLANQVQNTALKAALELWLSDPFELALDGRHSRTF